MNTEINDNNYKDYIEKLHLKQKYDLLICMPTFKSFDITSETITSFLNQKKVYFDLMVTGPTGDIERLIEKFPQINYCLTKDNYGGSGNQLLNIFISRNSNYTYVMLTDNDALLLEDDGIHKMLKNMNNNNLLAIFPTDYAKKSLPFHCAVYKVDLFKMMKTFFLPYYFLQYDDIAFTSRLNKFKDRFDVSDVKYFHPLKPEKFLNYNLMFFTLRSFFIFIFLEKVGLVSKFRISETILYPLVIWFINSILYFDFMFFKIFFLSLYQVITKNFEMIKFPKEKFFYRKVEITSNIDTEIYKFQTTLGIIFPQKYLKCKDLSGYKYFVLERN